MRALSSSGKETDVSSGELAQWSLCWDPTLRSPRPLVMLWGDRPGSDGCPASFRRSAAPHRARPTR